MIGDTHDDDMSESGHDQWDLGQVPSAPRSTIANDAFIIVRPNGTASINGKIRQQLSEQDLSEACILLKDAAGNYHNTHTSFDRIEIPENVKKNIAKLPPEARGRAKWDYRLPIWQYRMEELGISRLRVQFLKPEVKQFQTGEQLSNILIKAKNGSVSFLNRYPGDSYKGKSFKEFKALVTEKYGQGVEIKLRSATGIMQDSAYLESISADKVEKAFYSLAQEYRPHKKDLPLAVVNLGGRVDRNTDPSPDRFVPIKALFHFSEKNESAAEWKRELQQGMLSHRVLFLSRDGNGYITPQNAARDAKYHTYVTRDVGLPGNFGREGSLRSVQIDRLNDLPACLVSNGIELRALNPVDPTPDSKDVFVANRNWKGERTGTYLSLEEYKVERRALPQDAAGVLGLSTDEFAMNKRHDEARTRPVVDNRPRGRGGLGL